jgi:phosphatidylglycerol---prolipoprotein diacylglyceryl transferase
MSAWQHLPEKLSPVFLNIGPLQLRWYGLMYVTAFAVIYLLLMYRLKTESIPLSRETVTAYFGWAIAGVLIGGRLGYVLFYEPMMIVENPLGILLPFDVFHGFRFTGLAGMSYHGGVLGVLILTLIFCRKHGISFWSIADLLAPAVPLGYTFGRLGNFLNGELYGRITSRPWGMYFPLDSSGRLRHPSQLYEALFEGLLLFTILWFARKNQRLHRLFFPLYLAGYGVARFFIEFVREPDAQLGTVLGPLTMGQLLCLLMILSAVVLTTVLRKQEC